MPPENLLGAQYRHGGRSFPLHNRKINPVSSHSFQAYLEAVERLAGKPRAAIVSSDDSHQLSSSPVLPHFGTIFIKPTDAKELSK
ncbi:hypothetical protein D3C76_1774250 [compost metagenome]